MSEDNFLHEPLPTPVLHTKDTDLIYQTNEYNKEEHVETSPKIDKGNLVPDLSGAQTRKEIPQSKKELCIYARKYPKRTRNQSIISASSQPEIPEGGRAEILQELPSNTEIPTSNTDPPTTIRKEIRTCTQKSTKISTNHPISKYASCHNLSQNHQAFTSKITNLFVLRNMEEALDDSN